MSYYIQMKYLNKKAILNYWVVSQVVKLVENIKPIVWHSANKDTQTQALHNMGQFHMWSLLPLHCCMRLYSTPFYKAQNLPGPLRSIIIASKASRSGSEVDDKFWLFAYIFWLYGNPGKVASIAF